jgi:hypothetical protein
MRLRSLECLTLGKGILRYSKCNIIDAFMMQKLNWREIWKTTLRKKCANIIDQARALGIDVSLKSCALKTDRDKENLLYCD